MLFLLNLTYAVLAVFIAVLTGNFGYAAILIEKFDDCAAVLT